MDWLIERFVSAGERTAFIHHGTPFSYGQMVDRISRLELQLRQAGVGNHDTVVVLADYAPEVVCLMLALARLRATVVPMTRGSVIEEDEVLSISGCTRRITFSPNGVTWEMETHSVPVASELMTEFRRTKTQAWCCSHLDRPASLKACCMTFRESWTGSRYSARQSWRFHSSCLTTSAESTPSLPSPAA